MTTVVLGPRPPELQALIDRRRALGLDGHDEVWDGVYVMAPFAHPHHGAVKAQLVEHLTPRARAEGLVSGDSFNLGSRDDFRVPDAGWHRQLPDTAYVATAALVLEVLSPDDRTFDTLPFYAGHRVQELLVAVPVERRVRCWQLVDGAYVEQPGSALLGVSMARLAAEVAWPA